ncbi:SRPBCC family protein [Yinghuangia soli]|uniref:SRPBCC domain-containing protein n=1 Tax=Yinghuangia soli TaxID=2908204 RepID=A0AA41PWX5_9ACTN|nr:SRPBCC domain-containing protein [Yinghuangia soli]MCF2527344.1 SRPBCC domain-containing protein [Yinghuangia soli]
MADYATSVDIDAPPEVVFAHLVTAEGLVAWMGEHAVVEGRPGGEFTVDIAGSPVRGRYLEVDAPHRVVVSWGIAGSPELPPGTSRVEFLLTAKPGGGTRLDLRQTGLPEVQEPAYARGWTHYLRVLAGVAAQQQAID